MRPRLAIILLGDQSPSATRRAAMQLARASHVASVQVTSLVVAQTTAATRWVTPLAMPDGLRVLGIEVDAPAQASIQWLAGVEACRRHLEPASVADWLLVTHPDVAFGDASLAACAHELVQAPPRTVAIAPLLDTGGGPRPAVLPGRCFAVRAGALGRVAWDACLDADPRRPLWWLSAQLARQGEIITSLAWQPGVLPLRARRSAKERSCKAQVREATPVDVWQRLQGAGPARDTLALQLARLTSRRVALVDEGPGANVVRRALVEAGAVIVDEHAAPAGLVIASLAPGRIMRAVRRRLERRLRRDVPLLVAWSPAPRPTLLEPSLAA